MSSISFTPKTKREKQLLVVAGFLAAFMIIATLYMLYGGSAANLIKLRNQRREEVAKLEEIAEKGPLYKRQMTDYVNRSLPPIDSTKNRYQKLIFDEATTAGFKNIDISLVSAKAANKGNDYQTFTFKLTGDASLETLTKLMRRFNEHNLLHFIKSLSIKPVEQSNRMAISMDIEAIALEQAKKKLDIDPNYRTDEAYLENLVKQAKEINDRALFSAYRPPPPERSTEEAPKPPVKFTEAMYTFISAVIEVNGVSQVWIERRLKGDKLKLVVGDKFELDGLDCYVREIDLSRVKLGVMVEDEKDPSKFSEEQFVVRVGKCIDDFEDEG